MDFCATKGIGNVGSGAEVDSILLLELCHGSEQGHIVPPLKYIAEINIIE